MFEELKTAKKVVGLKQLRRAVQGGLARGVLLAEDADPWLLDEVESLCRSAGLTLTRVPSKKALGAACGISVGAATAAILSDPNE